MRAVSDWAREVKSRARKRKKRRKRRQSSCFWASTARFFSGVFSKWTCMMLFSDCAAASRPSTAESWRSPVWDVAVLFGVRTHKVLNSRINQFDLPACPGYLFSFSFNQP